MGSWKWWTLQLICHIQNHCNGKIINSVTKHSINLLPYNFNEILGKFYPVFGKYVQCTFNRLTIVRGLIARQHGNIRISTKFISIVKQIVWFTFDVSRNTIFHFSQTHLKVWSLFNLLCHYYNSSFNIILLQDNLLRNQIYRSFQVNTKTSE